MKSYLLVVRIIPTLLAMATFVASAQQLRLQPLESFGLQGDGSLRPGDQTYLTGDGNRYQRGMAVSPVTGHVLVVDRRPGSEGIHIIDGELGTDLGMLDLSNLDRSSGNTSFLINMIGVADDGAIYAANLSNSTQPGNPQVRLYRWANELEIQELVFSGDPTDGNANTSNWRWGDTIAVRGSGIGTQVLMASRGTVAGILHPVDESMTTFVSTPLNADVTAGRMGYGLAFGSGDTFWATGGAQSGGPLLQLQFNLVAGTATTVHTYSASNFPGTVSALGVQVAGDLLAGLDIISGPDLVRFYGITDLSAPPVLLDRKSFVTTNDNSVLAGAVAFGNNRLYVLDSDNGLMAYDIIESSDPVAPSIFLQPTSRIVPAGTNVTFTAAADGTLPLAYEWRLNGTAIPGATSSSLTVSNVQNSDAGPYTLLVTNNAGSVTSTVASLTILTTPTTTFLAYEPFNYAPGTVLATTNGEHGGWLLNSGTSGTIEAGNLTVPGLPNAVSNRFTWGNGNMSVRYPIGGISNGAVYFSFALRVDMLGTFASVGTLAGFATNTGSFFATKVNITNVTGGSYRLGTSKAGGTTFGSFAPHVLNERETVFVVGRYTFNTGSVTDDISDLWINPPTSSYGAESPPPPDASGGAGGGDMPYIDRFFLRAAGSGSSPVKETADELRLGLTWASVTAAPPEPKPGLRIDRSLGDILISWPTQFVGFTLYGTFTLAPSGSTWSAVDEPANVAGTNYSVRLDSPGGNRFFRLQK